MRAAVLRQAPVDGRDDLVHGIAVQAALGGDVLHEGVDALMLGAPLASARAADDGRASPFAAAAYFSKGTWSAAAAPSERHSELTQS